MFNTKKINELAQENVYIYQAIEGVVGLINVCMEENQDLKEEVDSLKDKISKLEEHLDLEYVPEEQVSKTEPAHYQEREEYDDITRGFMENKAERKERKKEKPEWAPRKGLSGCKDCGTSERPHQGRGYCPGCYYHNVIK